MCRAFIASEVEERVAEPLSLEADALVREAHLYSYAIAVMALIVMVYIVMAFTVMAYIVMTYVVGPM